MDKGIELLVKYRLAGGTGGAEECPTGCRAGRGHGADGGGEAGEPGGGGRLSEGACGLGVVAGEPIG